MTLLVIGLVVFAIFACAAVAIVIALGGETERKVGWSFMITIVATQIASLFGPYWHGPEYAVMAVDGTFAAWLTLLACRSTKWWPIWAAAAQLNGTIMHIAPIVLPNLPDTIYLWIQPSWAVAVLIPMLSGVWSHRRHPALGDHA